MRAIQIITALKKTPLDYAQRTTVPGHQHYILPRLPLDELHHTVKHRKKSADSLVAAHFRAQNVIFGGRARCGMSANESVRYSEAVIY